MKITRAALTRPDPPRRRPSVPRPFPARRLPAVPAPVWLTLLGLAFGAGLLLPFLFDIRPVAAPSLSPLAPIPAAPDVLSLPTPTATAPELGDTLATVYLEIPPDSWARITAKRDEALRLGILLVGGRDYVPATLRCGDETWPVELRLKGDWIDHLIGDKWSFRVRIRGEGSLFGMRVFSLQDPSTRSYLYEWLFLENLRREGVLTVRYRFVHVVLNGEYKGIYALEEGFAKELLESRHRREGPIIRYDEDLMWAYRALYDDQLIPPGVNRFHLIDEFQSARVAADPDLAAMRDTAVGLLRAVWTGDLPPHRVFDRETLARFLALSDLWSAPHGLIWHNLRYYYNPLTARLEPIAYDSNALAGDLDTAGLPFDVFYDDPYLQADYLREAERISRPIYLDALQAGLAPAYERLRAALETEFGPDVLSPPWDILRRRQSLLREVLEPYRMTYAYLQRPPVSATAVVTLDVGNLLSFPLELAALETADGTRTALRRAWAVTTTGELLVSDTGDTLVLSPLPAGATALPYLHLRLPRALLPPDSGDLTLITRLWGLSQEHREPVLPGYPSPLTAGPLPPRPTPTETLAAHSYLTVAVGLTDTLAVVPGRWHVVGDLVLPPGYGLRLSAGTTLRFDAGQILLADGPLDWRGTADAPIVLEPITDTWGGVVVLESPTPSLWHHVTISGTSGVRRAGWLLTGGVTFYRSPVRLDHCRILSTHAEDALNIVRAPFEIVWSEFGGHVSDGLDVDFGQGRVADSSFHDLGGDALDFSGSTVEITRVIVRRVADKGVSAGEGSRLTAGDLQMENVDFGLVAKDLSRVTLRRATITQARIAALAVYVKKATYGPATMIADGVRFPDTPPERQTLVQTGCTLVLDGQSLPGVAVDVDALYRR